LYQSLKCERLFFALYDTHTRAVVLNELKGVLQQSVTILNANKPNMSMLAVKLRASDAADDFSRDERKTE
jgi:hypothetical protein